jgi:hypothetical protein
MEPLTPEEIASRHRYMAVEANNLAWQLSVADRTPEEDQEMLNSAHASAWHWSIVGTELNHMRATMLLAEVHALCGMGQTAYVYARRMYGYFTSRETEAWEMAFTYAIHARAALAAGYIDAYRVSYEHAVALIANLSDVDRPIVEMTFKSIPKPPTIG